MKNKVAIVTDSNSGITQPLAKELGIFVLPMPFLINGTTYFEDISLTQDAFYQRLGEDAEISTSQPTVGDVIDLWNRALADYDELVHIPMSSALSGSCETAQTLAADFNGRVAVVDNQRISITQRQSVMDALALAGEGRTAAEIRDTLERVKMESSIYIMLDTLKYLKKGGRITPAAAAIATVLRIRPVLQIQGGKLDAFAKARSEKLGREIMIDAMRKDIANRFGSAEQIHLAVAHTANDQAAAEFSEMLRAELGAEITFCDPLSLSVACHIGPNALAVGCSRKLEYCL